MKPLWTLLALLLAPLAAAAGPMGYDEARLLLGRAGFGGTQQQVSEYAALSRQQAVERLLAGAREIPETPLLPPYDRRPPFDCHAMGAMTATGEFGRERSVIR
jgi:hypothetical protein